MEIIKCDKNRTSLGEGRNFGVGFSILKYTNEGLKEMLPFTACKDYLNDVVHIEKYNNVLGVAYGLNYSNNNYFEHDDNLYLGVTALNETGKSKDTIDEVLNNLIKTNSINIVRVLNYFERKMKVPKSTIFQNEDGILVIKVDKFWAQETFLISLYTLIIRFYINYTDKLNAISLAKHIPYIKGDAYLFNQELITFLFNEYKELTVYKETNYVYPNVVNIISIHNYGIKAFIRDNGKHNKINT